MTKINARSPYYLSFSTPTEPIVAFDCNTADAQGFVVDQEGVITLPALAYGTIHSFTSSDAGFSDGKYATVTTDTLRTVTLTIAIPTGFSNSGFIDCDVTFTQPKKETTGSTPSCSDGPTTNGSIPNQSLNSAGNTASITLSSYFTQGTLAISEYVAINYHKGFVGMSISGSTLTLTSGNTGGTRTVYVRASDSGTNTCTAIQSIQVTITVPNALGCTASSGVDSANLQGGAIAQDGTITNPEVIGTITAIKETSGGATVTSVAANTNTSAISKTLFFDITVPTGYSNATATIECSKTFSQAGTGLEAFTCNDLVLTEQGVYTDGSIKQGKTTAGTITGFSPTSFPVVSVDTSRSIDFTITPPASGYSNSGGSDITCSTTVTQPAQVPVCGTNSFYIGQDLRVSAVTDFCEHPFAGFNDGANQLIKSTATDLLGAVNKTVCYTNSAGDATAPYNGGDFYYRVDTFRNNLNITTDSAGFVAWRINDSGVVTEVWRWSCQDGGQGSGVQY